MQTQSVTVIVVVIIETVIVVYHYHYIRLLFRPAGSFCEVHRQSPDRDVYNYGLWPIRIPRIHGTKNPKSIFLGESSSQRNSSNRSNRSSRSSRGSRSRSRRSRRSRRSPCVFPRRKPYKRGVAGPFSDCPSAQ